MRTSAKAERIAKLKTRLDALVEAGEIQIAWETIHGYRVHRPGGEALTIHTRKDGRLDVDYHPQPFRSIVETVDCTADAILTGLINVCSRSF